MRSHYQGKGAQSHLWGLFMVFLAISIALFALDTLSGGFVRSYARAIGSVAWNAGAGAVSTIDRSGILATHSSLKAENDALAAEIEIRDQEALRFQMLEEENTLLRELAKLAAQSEGVSARVISSFYTSPYGTFRLDAGLQSGIRVGDGVLSPGGFVLGVVSDVDVYSATAESIFAPGKRTEFLLGDIRFEGEGRGGGNARAEVPRDASIQIGDVAISPIFGSRAAAVVGKVESASSSASQILYVRSPQNFSTLRFVYVVHR